MGMCNNTLTDCSLVTIYSGPYFYGALWDGDRVKVESLTAGFVLATHWRERKSREAIVSSLDEFLLAVDNIQAHRKIEAQHRIHITMIFGKSANSHSRHPTSTADRKQVLPMLNGWMKKTSLFRFCE
jgi:hypothetical protein